MRRTRYTVRVTRGDGARWSVGRFKTKAEAKKRVKKIKSKGYRRRNADTKNPRVKKFKGVF